MGYLKEKYTREYFLGIDSAGHALSYGVDGIDAFNRGEIRERDRKILEKLDFHGARVLEFGYGRGEALKFAHDCGAESVVGIDFSESAHQIALRHLEAHKASAKLLCGDALEVIRQKQGELAAAGPYNIVLMLDFVEHIPRAELSQVLVELRGLMAEQGVLAISTPIFRFDNDALKQGFNAHASDKDLDTSDFQEETRGMHCNKFTEESLPIFLQSAGFESISPRDCYIKKRESAPALVRDFAKEWQDFRAAGYPLAKQWTHDEPEYAFHRPIMPAWTRVESGALKGAEVLVAQTNPSHVAFVNGRFEEHLLSLAKSVDLKGKTVLDIGGHIGLVSLHFASLVGEGGKVVAFEPNPANIRRMRLNLAKNRELANRVAVVPLALSDQRGMTGFVASDQIDNGYSSAGFLSAAHTTLPSSHFDEIGFFQVEARTETLDGFLGTLPDLPVIGLIKLDVEGSEHLVLAGARDTLKRHKPALLIEVHSPYCMARSLSILEQLGYCCRIVKEELDGRCILMAEYDWVGSSFMALAKVGQSLRKIIATSSSDDRGVKAGREMAQLMGELVDAEALASKEEQLAKNLIERLKEQSALAAAGHAKESAHAVDAMTSKDAQIQAKAAEVEALQQVLTARSQEIECILKSRRYRIGSFIMGPLSALKNALGAASSTPS